MKNFNSLSGSVKSLDLNLGGTFDSPFLSGSVKLGNSTAFNYVASEDMQFDYNEGENDNRNNGFKMNILIDADNDITLNSKDMKILFLPSFRLKYSNKSIMLAGNIDITEGKLLFCQ